MIRHDVHLEIPASDGRAFSVTKGQRLRLITPKGQQAADFFAYSAGNVQEWLSPMHTWVTTFSIKPRAGDVLISRFRRPMLEVTEDGADGMQRHDAGGLRPGALRAFRFRWAARQLFGKSAQCHAAPRASHRCHPPADQLLYAHTTFLKTESWSRRPTRCRRAPTWRWWR